MSSIDRGPTIPRVRVDGVEVTPPVHPRHAYIGADGFRNLDMENSVYPREDGAIVYSDVLDRREPIAVVIEMPAEGLEWLIEQVSKDSPNDRFVKALGYARELAKVVAWDRASGVLS